jgi:type VI protein secretion system component Hcp
MTKNLKLRGNAFGRIGSGAAILLLTGSAPLFLSPSAMAAMDAYLQIPGMDGGSKDAAHMNWISSSVVTGDLNGEAAADREASNPSVSEVTATKARIGSQSSGAGAGKATTSRDAMSGMATGKRMHKPFVVSKELDKASPLLSKACVSGQHLHEVDVDLGGSHYKLSDVVISSDTKSGGDHPMETITFTYQKIEMK